MFRLMIAICMGMVCAVCTAQTYPNRPLRMIIPYAPGGGLDTTARLIAQKLSMRLGQPVVPENHAGVDGIVGTEYASHAEPDGYTLVMVNMSHAINVATGRKLPYDTLKAFAGITQTNNQQLLLVVNPSVPAKSVKELIALLKAKPGSMNYGASSSAAALPMELFKSMTGTQATEIPYKGTGPMLTEMIGGWTQMSFAASLSTLPFVKAGKLRALAIGDDKRSDILPDIPTVSEAGVPGYQAVLWNGILVPAGTPKPIVERLNREIVAVLKMPDVRGPMERSGSDVVGSTPAQWEAFIRSEIQKWTRIAKTADIKP